MSVVRGRIDLIVGTLIFAAFYVGPTVKLPRSG